MRERNEAILADLIALRAEQKPDLDVLTFERWSLGGDFINPGFVEKGIAEHPGVSDVFVYGIAAASGAPGEKDVVAGTAFEPAALFAHCRKGLEANAVPSYLQVVDEIPKTASEKPQERFLLDRFAPAAPGVWVEATPMRTAAAATGP